MITEEATGKMLALATHCRGKHDTLDLAIDMIEEIYDEQRASNKEQDELVYIAYLQGFEKGKDSLGNQKCENCKYWTFDEDDGNNGYCELEVDDGQDSFSNKLGASKTEPDFGCNKWLANAE